MLVELHLLTPHAPSNLNRDDFGRPKSALFGGTERARISSQAIKRSLRTAPFVQEQLAHRLSTRSLYIPEMIYRELLADMSLNDAEKDRLKAYCSAISLALGKADKDNPLKTNQIVFLTRGEIDRIKTFIQTRFHTGERLTDKAVKELGEKMNALTGLNVRPSDGVDMAMFGRMTTDDGNSFAHVDASVQVAHAISTHTAVTETDYFTAVDDWRSSGAAEGMETRGSGHIGEVDFNSAVYYKYFSCHLDRLVQNLGNDKDSALEGLSVILDAACRITPTGKQNTFASHNLAEVALLVVRKENIPCSLASAFERPVPPSENGYLAESARRMVQQYMRLTDAYGLADSHLCFALQPDWLPTAYAQRAERLNDLWVFLRKAITSNLT